MKFSIGILAHNEEKNIARTLESLFTQTIFEEHEIQVVVYCNGCTDNTFKIADRVLENFEQELGRALPYLVIGETVAGKANAWNEFVHEFSKKDSDLLILMDADIEFCETNILELMHGVLELSGKEVCTGHPIKSATLKKNKTLLERLSLMMGNQRPANPQICGQLYMAKAETLRKIVLPIGITGDDGFIAEMISTNLLTEPYDSRKYMVSLGVPSHTFEAYTDPKEWLKHEIGQVKGIIINEWLYTRIRERRQSYSIKEFIDHCNKIMDKEWTKGLAYTNIQYNQGQNIPMSMYTRRFKNFNFMKLPITVATTLLDWYVFHKANKDLNEGKFTNYWR